MFKGEDDQNACGRQYDAFPSRVLDGLAEENMLKK